MKTLNELLKICQQTVAELFPWDLAEMLDHNAPLIILDVREPSEFNAMHIANSIHVPRGVLEAAVEWNYDDTLPELVQARDKTIIVVCRSGTRSLLAAQTMQLMGFRDVRSLQTGLRGWNDYEQPLIDGSGNLVDEDLADEFLSSRVRPEQLAPK